MHGSYFLNMVAAILGNRKFENYRETSRKPDAGVAFHKVKK